MTSAGVATPGGWIWRPLVGAALSQVILGITRPTASYAGLAMDVDPAMIGVIAASFTVLPMLVALPVGAIAGRWRYIGAVPGMSALLAAVACAFAALAESLPGMLCAFALIGVANLGILVGAQAWISRSAPVERYTAGFGWMTAGMALGQAVGPLVAGMLLGDGPVVQADAVSAAFWVAAVLGAVTVLVFAHGAARSYEEDAGAAAVRAAAILRTPGVFRAVVVGAAVLTTVDILIAYLPVIGAEAGIAPVVVGAMLAVRGVASMSSRLLLGPLGRRFGSPALMIVSTAGSALCLLVMALAPLPWVMFLMLAIGGFLLGMGQPLSMAAVAVALPAASRSSGLAVRLLGNRIAQTAVPLIAGGVTALVGTGGVLLVQVAGLLLSAGWEVARRRD